MIKFIHVIGAVLFLGNIILSAIWRISAERTGNGHTIRHAVKMVTFTDWVLTVPGVLMLIGTGHMLAGKYGGIGAHLWIHMGYAMLFLSALIWLAFLLPIQRKQLRLLDADPDHAHLDASFQRHSRWWMIWGSLATIFPLAALFLMSVKPG